MTYQTPTGLTARLHTLAGRLASLHHRVREAVAVEVGRILGEAIRDLTTAVLRGHLPGPTTAPDFSPGHSRGGRWDDDPDDWDRDEELDPDEPKPDPPTRAPDVSLAPSPNWIAVLAGGAAVARYWAGRTGRWWVGSAVGVVTAVTSVSTNPVLGAALSVFTALAELVLGVLPAPS